MSVQKSRAVKIRDGFVLAGTILAVFTPIWFAAAALGTKFGLWDWTVGLLRMTGQVGVPLIGILILVTFITSLLVVFIKPRAGFTGLGAMWLVAIGAATFALMAINGARAVPPIHDISTNTRAPLAYSDRVIAERGPKANKILPPNEATVPFNRERLSDWSGRSLVEIQADAYPQVQTLMIEGQQASDIYTKAVATAKSQGLKVTAQDPAERRIEAVAETFWYGFKDDVIIVVTPNANGGAVDMRSTSRVGISDMGANAKRIEAFLAAMKG
jgi:hypothetical protein